MVAQGRGAVSCHRGNPVTPWCGGLSGQIESGSEEDEKLSEQAFQARTRDPNPGIQNPKPGIQNPKTGPKLGIRD